MGILGHIATNRFRHDVTKCLIGGLALAAVTAVCYRLRLNVTTAALLYVIVVVLLAWVGNLISSIIASIIAALCLAYLTAPANSFRVDDPLDVVAISAFLITSFVIGRLVSQLQKATDEALSSVNRRLVDSEEKERTRIARDLHDDIGQRLALLLIKLEQLQQNSSGLPAEVCDGMAELHTKTFEIATDIQALSHELHSSKLEYLGLERAMENFCAEFGQQQKCEIHFRSYDLPRPLPLNISVSLFRVLQQALRNVATHSGAANSKVELFGKTDAIYLVVRDSGIGFNPTAAMKGTGLGLISMRERMKLVNGTLSIDSQAHHGATIRARVPLPPRS